jgi:hypothetical protein
LFWDRVPQVMIDAGKGCFRAFPVILCFLAAKPFIRQSRQAVIPATFGRICSGFTRRKVAAAKEALGGASCDSAGLLPRGLPWQWFVAGLATLPRVLQSSLRRFCEPLGIERLRRNGLALRPLFWDVNATHKPARLLVRCAFHASNAKPLVAVKSELLDPVRSANSFNPSRASHASPVIGVFPRSRFEIVSRETSRIAASSAPVSPSIRRMVW